MSQIYFQSNYRQHVTKDSVLKNLLNKIYFNGLTHVLLGLSLVLMIVVTLSSSGEKMTKGNVISSLESSKQELVRLNEIVDNEISKVRTLNFIKDASHVKNMRSPHVVTYVNGETAIAKN